MSGVSAATFEVVINSFGHRGVGVGRRDGQVVFVKGALPGDRLRVRAPESSKSFVHAELVEVITPSDLRTEPACAMAARGAGCCDLSHVRPESARELKSQVLGEQLRRIGHLDVDNPPVIAKPAAAQHDSATASRYRIRARFGVDADGRLGMRGHDASVVVGGDCLQLDQVIADAAATVTASADAEVVAAVGSDGQLHLVEVKTSRRRGRGARRPARQAAGAAERVLSGSGTVRQQVGDTVWQVPATGFWQAHRDAPRWYSDVVADVVASLPGTDLVGWDLYGGVGVLSAAQLADARMSSVHLVEGDRRALDAAAAALPTQRLRTYAGSVSDQVRHLPHPDVVVSDPPRTGAGADVVAAICAAQPTAIVAVGCDPATFARDLADFIRGGYQAASIVGFDAFGQTHHVEAIAVLAPTR